jgi:FeS assembly SUF system protein
MDPGAIREKVIKAIRTVFDPEIPVNIYELGLIYRIDVSDAGAVNVRMTLTSPNCPVAESLPRQVRQKIEAIEGVRSANVEIVFDPPWTKDRMSEAAKLELDFLGIDDPARLHGPKLTNLTIGRKANRDERRN